MNEREREEWIRRREAESLASLSPGARADLERLRAVRPDLAERFEALRDKVISAVFGRPAPTPSERDGHLWYTHTSRDFVHVAFDKGGNPVTDLGWVRDVGLAMLAARHGVPYEALVQATDERLAAQHKQSFALARNAVLTAVARWREHFAECGLPHCSGDGWQHLVAGMEYEQLALVFAAATEMLSELLPPIDIDAVRADVHAAREHVTPGDTVEDKLRNVTASLVERARQIESERREVAEEVAAIVEPGEPAEPAE